MASAKKNSTNSELAAVDIDSIYGVVYKIVCAKNSKVFIGQTLSTHTIEEVFSKHKLKLLNDNKCPLYADMREYGINHFHIEEIERLNGADVLNLDARVVHYVNEYNAAVPNGYNVCGMTCGGNIKIKKALKIHYNPEKSKRAKKAKRAKPKIEEIYGIIYKIVCDVNKKIYVGQTLSHRGLDIRFAKHKNAAKNGAPHPLCDDMRIYGFEHFSIEEVERVSGSQITDLDARETHYIKECNALVPNGYNIYATGFNNNPMKKELTKHYKLHKQYSDEYKSRQTRTKEITTSDVHVLDDKHITKIEIRTIHSKSNAAYQIRVCVSIENFRDKYRFQFSSKNLKTNIDEALKFVDNKKQANTQVVIAREVLDLKQNIYKTYKYQDKLDKILSISGSLIWISGLWAYHKTKKIWLYTLFFKYTSQSKAEPIQFGGKHTTPVETHTTALEFVEKVKTTNKCNDSTQYRLKSVSSIDESSTGSCPGACVDA